MSFNFFGTLTDAQWWDFKDFAAVQRPELEARKRWVDAQLTRVGSISCTYNENNVPVSYEASPKSYVGKLLLAYRMLGGVPENDMLLRKREQVVFLKRGIDQNDTPNYTNGRVFRGSQRFDRTLGLKMESMKQWQLEAIKAKRESLEFKIKRALDYADQLEQESALLMNFLGVKIDIQIADIEFAQNDPNGYHMPSDPGDRHGLAIGVPGDGSFDDAAIVAAAGSQRVP